MQTYQPNIIVQKFNGKANRAGNRADRCARVIALECTTDLTSGWIQVAAIQAANQRNVCIRLQEVKDDINPCELGVD